MDVDGSDGTSREETLADRLGELFKPAAGGRINISAAARRLGVSRDTVRRMRDGAASPTGVAALEREERRESRRPGWVEGAHEGKVAHQLFPDGMPKLPGERDIPAQLAMVAARKPDGSIHITRTAQALQVSARTLGRWLRGEARPREAHQELIRSEVRATALSNSDGAMSAAVMGHFLTLNFMAKISDDRRRRNIRREYTADQMSAAQLAWMNGGDEGLQQWLERDLEVNYFREVPSDEVAVSDIDGR